MYLLKENKLPMVKLRNNKPDGVPEPGNICTCNRQDASLATFSEM